MVGSSADHEAMNAMLNVHEIHPLVGEVELSLKLVYAAWRRDGRRRWRLKENVASHGNTSTIELHHHGETYAGN
jgi:hypothetical protein